MLDSYDVICIGLGTTALSIAIALEERNNIKTILFLEKQQQETWQPHLNQTGHRMRTSLMEDLITSENPRSKYTFINYLHKTNQLVTYTNLSQLQPTRETFQTYLEWCAMQCASHVQFGKQVVAVEAVRSGNGMVSSWKVCFHDHEGQFGVVIASKVICATGVQPQIHSALVHRSGTSVIHSSKFDVNTLQALRGTKIAPKIATVGNGQIAAEIFDSLHNPYGQHRATWFMEDQSPQMSDDSGFIRHTIKVPRDRWTPPELRRTVLTRRNPNKPSETVDKALLERLYETQYEQSIKEPDSSRWRFQIKTGCQVLSAEPKPSGNQVEVQIQTISADGTPVIDRSTFDLVVSATGYHRSEFQKITKPLRSLLDSEDGHVQVDKNYRVNFRSGLVSQACGLWIYGSLDSDEDVEDSKFAIIAESARRLTESLLACEKPDTGRQETAAGEGWRVTRL